MRTRSLTALAIVLVLALVVAGGAYAYDGSRSDVIAKGVTVSGVDVGGETTSQARAELERTLLDPLKEPVTVAYKGRRFRLTPEQAQVGIDLDGSVDAALKRSRKGGLVTRVLREVRGERVQADVPVTVNYDKGAVRRMVARIGEALAQPAQDAKVSFDGGRIDRQPSQDGRAVRTAALRRDIDEKLLATEGSRIVHVHTRTVTPAVTTDKVAQKYPAVLMVDRKNHKLTLYKDLEPAETYGIALGRVGLETPAGLYTIQNKAVDPAWHVPNSDWAGALAGKVIPGGAPDNPIKARWLGVADGVGIHGTAEEDSIGTDASHGCIRMRVAEIKKLYDEVPVGAPIYIN
jgi:lipoprotein-anchoring transpeptidase ErfK/SrfK